MSQTVVVAGEEFDFDFQNPSNLECMRIEEAFGGTFKDWGEAMAAGSMKAVTCLVFVLRKRTEPRLLFGNVEFKIGEVQILDPDNELGLDDETVPDEDDGLEPEPPMPGGGGPLAAIPSPTSEAVS